MAKIKTKRPTDNRKDNRKGLPPMVEEASNVLTPHVIDPNPVVKKDLNFKVDPDFKVRFKTYASSNGMTMIELLMACFEYYEEGH